MTYIENPQDDSNATVTPAPSNVTTSCGDLGSERPSETTPFVLEDEEDTQSVLLIHDANVSVSSNTW